RIIEALINIHKTGVRHGDFAERNVLIRQHPTTKTEFLIRIIDFGSSQLHKCGFEGEVIEHNGLQPDEKEFGCDELYEVC
ncbi:hypothetical protein CONPUDRAFT_41544, partial [Coniophora puteana RWD-64-598 SS2]